MAEHQLLGGAHVAGAGHIEPQDAQPASAARLPLQPPRPVPAGAQAARKHREAEAVESESQQVPEAAVAARDEHGPPGRLQPRRPAPRQRQQQEKEQEQHRGRCPHPARAATAALSGSEGGTETRGQHPPCPPRIPSPHPLPAPHPLPRAAAALRHRPAERARREPGIAIRLLPDPAELVKPGVERGFSPPGSPPTFSFKKKAQAGSIMLWSAGAGAGERELGYGEFQRYARFSFPAQLSLRRPIRA